MLPPNLRNAVEIQLDTPITAVFPVSGGDIHRAFHLRTARGDFFLKSPTHAHGAALLRAESRGLDYLAQRSPLPVPRRIGRSDAPPYLLLEYLAPGTPTPAAWETLGRGLAGLHRVTAPQYGLDHDNFIGTLPQSNRRHATWAAFYAQERLRPQLRAARDADLLDQLDTHRAERLLQGLPDLLPEEAPALTHGDLWSGNFHCTADGRMYLIDPAICYAHRETDLALARLFGGFDDRFFAAYEAAFPLQPGAAERLPVYQLYYLLAHLKMFGGRYRAAVRRIVRAF